MSREVLEEFVTEEALVILVVVVDLEGNQGREGNTSSVESQNTNLIGHQFQLVLQGSGFFLIFFTHNVLNSSLARVLTQTKNNHLTITVDNRTAFEDTTSDFLVLYFIFTS